MAAEKVEKIVTVFGSVGRIIQFGLKYEHSTRGLPGLPFRTVALQGRREDLQKYKQYRCIVDTVG